MTTRRSSSPTLLIHPVSAYALAAVVDFACELDADFMASGICGNVVRVAERQPAQVGGRNENKPVRPGESDLLS
ncbi:hypothetical protein, partial [Streptacidiphilus albus]|uniref:hypothetical protein n=1 Tax=Streptacidiphilus albus TaxID=105425 RepID=UPI001F387A5B